MCRTTRRWRSEKKWQILRNFWLSVIDTHRNEVQWNVDSRSALICDVTLIIMPLNSYLVSESDIYSVEVHNLVANGASFFIAQQVSVIFRVCSVVTWRAWLKLRASHESECNFLQLSELSRVHETFQSRKPQIKNNWKVSTISNSFNTG